ncbi:MAG TPA: metal-dependent phosphohydrolase [Idiomarina sp.]|nr:metal-dependent phosphohydrolase [Idiomarina sp.]
MTIFERPAIDDEVYQELLDEIKDLHQQAETSLIALEHEPNNEQHQHSVYRSIHTIKGDLGIIGLSPMVAVIGAIEDLLDLVRKGDMSYNSVFSDIVLSLIDQVTEFVETCQNQEVIDVPDRRYQSVIDLSADIIAANDTERQPLLGRLLARLSPELILDSDIQPQQQYRPPHTEDDWDYDLRFFRRLMAEVERRSSYWHDRADRQLKIALMINRYAGSPVDEKQLTAACYVHDFGMGFMPLTLLHQSEPLTPDQHKSIQNHVYLSAKLLENLDYWKAAKLMVLQHHEHADGNGYPLGLKDNEISDGAKILALVDTFDAMTHERAHQHHLKRPISRAVAEINRLAATQLSPYWVTVFNEAMNNLVKSWR